MLQFTKKFQAGDDHVVIKAESNVTVTIMDITQTGGMRLARTTLRPGENVVTLSQRLSGGHTILALVHRIGTAATVVVGGKGCFVPPSPPPPPKPPPPPPPPIHVFLRTDPIPTTEGWLIRPGSETCLLYEHKTGTVVYAYGQHPHFPRLEVFIAEARKRDPSLPAKRNNWMVPTLIPEALMIRGGVTPGQDWAEHIDIAGNCIRRLRSIGAIPGDFCVIVHHNDDQTITTAADW